MTQQENELNYDCGSPPWYCSFCGQHQNEVKKLIAGPSVFIFNECIELSMDILVQENVPCVFGSKESAEIEQLRQELKQYKWLDEHYVAVGENLSALVESSKQCCQLEEEVQQLRQENERLRGEVEAKCIRITETSKINMDTQTKCRGMETALRICIHIAEIVPFDNEPLQAIDRIISIATTGLQKSLAPTNNKPEELIK